jgi:hypothetical protein
LHDGNPDGDLRMSLSSWKVRVVLTADYLGLFINIKYHDIYGLELTKSMYLQLNAFESTSGQYHSVVKAHRRTEDVIPFTQSSKAYATMYVHICLYNVGI